MAAVDYDFTATRNQIIQAALRKIGALSLGQIVSAEEFDAASIALNELVKSWQNKHLFLWTLVPQTKAVTNASASYAFPTDPAVYAIDRAYIRDSANNDRPIKIISWREYQDIPNKTDPGEPCCVTVDNQASGTFYLWPKPNANYTLFYLGIVKLKDWDSASGSADFPVKFQRALIYSLAADLADEYSLPQGERILLANKAAELFHEAKRDDRDRSDFEVVTGGFLHGK